MLNIGHGRRTDKVSTTTHKIQGTFKIKLSYATKYSSFGKLSGKHSFGFCRL